MAQPWRKAIAQAFRRGELSWGDAIALSQWVRVYYRNEILHHFSVKYDTPLRYTGGFRTIDKHGVVPFDYQWEKFKVTKWVGPDPAPVEKLVREGVHSDLSRYVSITESGLSMLCDYPQILREAIVHADECTELNKTPAGAKAQELLFDHLTPEQQDYYRYYGYFDVVVHGDIDTEVRAAVNAKAKFRVFSDRLRDYTPREREQILPTRRYRIHRGYPNGNVFMLNYEHTPIATVCLHPEEPFPTDDTLLTQKLWIEQHEEEFLLAGNFTRTRLDYLHPDQRITL